MALGVAKSDNRDRSAFAGLRHRLGRSRRRHARHAEQALQLIAMLVDEGRRLVEGKDVVLLRFNGLEPLHLGMALGGIGRHLGDPARLVGRGEGRGDDREGPLLADLLRHVVDQRLGDAVELRLVDEPLAGIGRRIGVIADDIDALRQGLLQHRGDRHRIIGGKQNAVDAAGDVVVDEADLLIDVGLGRPVGLGLDIAELGGGIGDPFRCRIEIADADQLRNIDNLDRLALAVGRALRLTAVIGLGRRPFPAWRRRPADWWEDRRLPSRPTALSPSRPCMTRAMANSNDFRIMS